MNCDDDTFKAGTDSATSCTGCPANSGVDNKLTGATAITACMALPGFYGTNGGTPTACPVDTFKDQTGAAACTACPTNTLTGGKTGSTASTACVAKVAAKVAGDSAKVVGDSTFTVSAKVTLAGYTAATFDTPANRAAFKQSINATFPGVNAVSDVSITKMEDTPTLLQGVSTGTLLANNVRVSFTIASVLASAVEKLKTELSAPDQSKFVASLKSKGLSELTGASISDVSSAAEAPSPYKSGSDVVVIMLSSVASVIAVCLCLYYGLINGMKPQAAETNSQTSV
jgi:hypothetical protein